MRCFTVLKSQIHGRLDPGYIYQHQTYSQGQSKYGSKTLGSLLIMPPQYGANESATDGNPATDYRYVRITDVDEFGNLRRDGWKTAANIDEKYLLMDGDVLFARSGATAGKTYIYQPNDGKAIFAGYMIRFRFDPKKVNPLFVFFYTQLNRYEKWVSLIQRPAGQPNINSEEFKALEIPVPDPKTQDKIIHTMKHAYAEKKRLEQEADDLLASIDAYILDRLGIRFATIPKKMCFACSSTTITKERFDPDYNSPHHNAVYDALNNSHYPIHDLDELSKSIFQGVGKNITEDDEYVLLKVKNIQQNNNIDFLNVEFVKDVPNNKKLVSGDIISPFIGEATRQYKFSVFKENNNQKYTVDNNVGVIRLNEKADPSFVTFFLMSSAGKRQLERLIGGGGVPFLGTNGAKALKIALPPIENQKEIASEVQSRMTKAATLKKQALDQLNQAKAEVEKILFGDAA